MTVEEAPNLNTGQPWSEMAVADLKWQVKWKEPVDRIASFMCRTEQEIRDKAREIGLGELWNTTPAPLCRCGGREHAAAREVE